MEVTPKGVLEQSRRQMLEDRSKDIGQQPSGIQLLWQSEIERMVRDYLSCARGYSSHRARFMRSGWSWELENTFFFSTWVAETNYLLVRVCMGIWDEQIDLRVQWEFGQEIKIYHLDPTCGPYAMNDNLYSYLDVLLGRKDLLQERQDGNHMNEARVCE